MLNVHNPAIEAGVEPRTHHCAGNIEKAYYRVAHHLRYLFPRQPSATIGSPVAHAGTMAMIRSASVNADGGRLSFISRTISSWMCITTIGAYDSMRVIASANRSRATA